MEVKITANKKELVDIGIDYNLEGLSAKVVGTFGGSAWYEIEVSHKIGNQEYTNVFDIPKSLTKPLN